MLIRLLTSLGALMLALPTLGQVVDLTADIEIVSNVAAGESPDLSTFQSRLWKTHCVIGANSWSINAVDEKGTPLGWSHDGTNLVLRLWDQPQKNTADSTHDRANTPASEFPSSIQDDVAVSPVLRIAWLAFCSGPYFKQPHPQVPLLSFRWKQSWLYQDYIAPPAGFQNKVVPFADALGLPTTVDVLSKSGQPLLQYRLKNDHPTSPAATNVAGWDFPHEFRASQYHSLNGSKDRWETELNAHGKLTSIKVRIPPACPPRNESLNKNQSYTLKAWGGFNLITNPPDQNQVKITLRGEVRDPDRVTFTVTNHEPDEILLWNVRVQNKCLGEDKGTDGFGWETISDGPPNCPEATVKPGQSIDVWIVPSPAPLWRVCLLYSKKINQSEPKQYGGNYEVVSLPLNDKSFEN